MGHYTGFQISVPLRKDVPPRAVVALLDAAGCLEKGVKYDPYHHEPFFKCERAPALFHGSSAYLHEPEFNTGFKLYAEEDFYLLEVGTSLKNYDNEITKFLYWLSPFVDPNVEGKIVGKYQYEDAEVSTPIVFGGKK